jgi:hypothetical protein
MKTFKSTLFLLMVLTYHLNAQTIECVTNEYELEQYLSGIESTTNNCQANSQAYLNKYRLQTNYIPSSTSIEAIKTIPINIVVFLEDDAIYSPFQVAGSIASYYDKNGNLTSGFSTTTPDVQHFEDWVNRAYSNTQPPNGIGWYAGTSTPAITTPQNVSLYLNDSKIRFVINHYYFYENSAIFNDISSTCDNSKLSYHFSKNPEAVYEINCLLSKYTSNTNPSAAGFYSYNTYNNLTIPYISTSTKIDYNLWQGNYFYAENHLSHELGHFLKLDHTYNYEQLITSHIDYLDDVFPNPPFYFNGDNVMGGGEPNDFISPKQMGRSHRTLSLNYERNFAYGYSSLPHDITQNETWDFTFKSYNDIVIKNGATLTLTCRLEMVPQAKIVVENGGKLIVDGGVITSARCGGPSHEGFWQGIVVQGDENLAQSPASNQGVLEIINSGTIENAKIAINVYQNKTISLYGSSITFPMGGGIIKINDANFVNNEIDIQMAPYSYINPYTQKPNNQMSYIIRSNFETNDNMFVSSTDPIHIKLMGINGMQIKGCTFSNNSSSADVIDNGIGIMSNVSSIKVIPYCDPQNPSCIDEPNTFVNLYYGIRIIDQPGSLALIDISENTFTNTYRSIFLSGTNNAKVLLNNIQVPDQAITQAGDPDPGTPYGIYLNGGRGFRVEENTLWRPSSNGPEVINGARGIIVNNTGGVNNEIYKNTTTNLFISEQAQGLNSGKGTNATKGLKYFCNTSNTSASSYDNYVFGGFTADIYGLHWKGIALDQKQSNPAYPATSSIPYLPAGNTFSASHSSSTIAADFDNSFAQRVTYTWGIMNGVSAPLEPTKYLNLNIEQIPGTHDACPSKISNGGNGSSLTSLYQNLYSAQLAYNSSKLLYDIWANGGISNLEQQVETTEPWEVYQQFNSLLAESPDLTPEVMIEIIRNSNFTSLMVKLLMLANPDLKDRIEVMQELELRIPSLPQTYIDEINNQVATTTQIRLLEGNMASDYHLLESIGEEIKYNYKTNTEDTWAKDSLIAFISRKPDIYDKYELAATYLSYGDYNNMTGVLNEIPSNFELNDEMNIELNNFTRLCNIVKGMDESGLYENGLTDEQRMEAQTILESNLPMLSSMALAILKRDNPSLEYFEIIRDVEENNLRIAHGDNNITAPSEDDLFRIYPNPTINFVTLKYDCRYVNMNYNITDMSGKALLAGEIKTVENAESNEELIDLSSLSPGSYTLEVRAKGLALWSQKLVINK